MMILAKLTNMQSGPRCSGHIVTSLTDALEDQKERNYNNQILIIQAHALQL